MPKSPNQKLKLLYLEKYLREKTDEAHPVTVQDMINELSRCGISAERKSIYDDIEALQNFGLDIIKIPGRANSYYVGCRDFELPELRLLVDIVQSSRFMTEKKTNSLIKKLEGLTSVYDGQLLHKDVFVRNRVKSGNENVYYNVDSIANAILQDRKIRFRHLEFTPTKESVFRRGGKTYELSPYALVVDDGEYYLIAYDTAEGRKKHFRVDKMREIIITDCPRDGKKEFEDFNISDYSKKTFGMFTGEEQKVTLRFANHLAGAVIDKFGSDVRISACDDRHFTVSADVFVSPKFISWIFGFGSDAECLSPECVRRQIRDSISDISKIYNTEPE